MKKFFLLMMLLTAMLSACMRDSLDNVRVSGDVTTVISTGHDSWTGSRMRTGIDF
jgi:Na+/H+ antiporter NhaC